MANCTLSLASARCEARSTLGRATASPAMMARPDTTRRPPANPAMTVATPRVMRKGERANPVASTTATPTATSRSSAAVVCQRPCSPPDGPHGPPQGVGDEHPAGHRGARAEVLDQPQGRGPATATPSAGR